MAWEPVGTLVADGEPAAILDPGLGRAAVVARGEDNLIYASFETAQGSGVFGNWTSVNPSEPAATDPTVAPLRNGSTEFWIIVYRTINGELRIVERRGIPA